MSESQTASLTMLAVTSSIGMYTSLLPSLADVRKAVNDPVVKNDVRMGEIAAGSLAVAIGLMASSLSNSPVPAMTAVVVALAVTCLYESILSATPKEMKAGT